MKKTFILVACMIVLGIALGVGQFWWSQLRGAGPALRQPKIPITDLIPTGLDTQTTTPGEAPLPANTTDFPLTLLPGFSISIYAKDLVGPRVITYDSVGNILASVPFGSSGKVVAVSDTDGDGFAEKIVTVASNLNRPHGLMFVCDDGCKLYIAEEDKVSMYDYDEITLKAINKKKLFDLPGGGRHFTRTLMRLPYPDEGRFLISIGSSCDVCHEEDPRRAAIYSAKLDGTDFKPYAAGLRNSVFMTIHPVSGETWATEMGRDHLGDNLPPDEVNIIKDGGKYGWPICYGKNMHDDVFDKNTYIRNPCMEPFETPSHIDLQAHSAPLGLAFIPEEGWPTEYWHDLLVSYHGSWNRSVPTGFKVVRFDLNEKGELQGPPQDFITGWLPAKNADAALGRPVDILVQPGGKIYISDDKAGVIYRVLYRPPNPRIKNPESMIRLDNIKPNDVVSSPLRIAGEAKGTWYFEASFPIQITDASGKVLANSHAEAQSDWMTEDFVPYEGKIIFTPPQSDTGYLILHRDNPSGLPEFDANISIPIRFR